MRFGVRGVGDAGNDELQIEHSVAEGYVDRGRTKADLSFETIGLNGQKDGRLMLWLTTSFPDKLALREASTLSSGYSARSRQVRFGVWHGYECETVRGRMGSSAYPHFLYLPPRVAPTFAVVHPLRFSLQTLTLHFDSSTLGHAL